jgi:hypothetical protein
VSAVRLITAVGLLAAWLPLAPAQEPAAKWTAFTTKADAPDETKNVEELQAADLAPRPNNASVVYLYVRNPLANQSTYTVELHQGGPTGPSLGRTVVKFSGNDVKDKWKRVKFSPPASPPPAAAPAPAADAKPAPAAEPPPPGVALKREATGFLFTLRLLDEKGDAVVKDENGRSHIDVVKVQFAKPDAYLTVDKPTVVVKDGAAEVSMSATPVADAKATPKVTADTPVNVRLAFAGSGLTLGDGVYTRTVSAAATLKGAVLSPPDTLTAYLSVDGVERAKSYTVKPRATTDQVNEEETPRDTRVRVVPLTPLPANNATRPVAAFPVRLEVDNPPADHTLELRVGRKKDQNVQGAEQTNEVFRFPAPRDEKVWLNPADPTGGIGLATKSSDWVKTLSLADLRGQIDLSAVLVKAGGADLPSDPLRLLVDATPPEVTFRDPGLKVTKSGARQLVKGDPLPVRAFATDGPAGTGIAKVVFFLGKPTEDGKPPAGAVLVEGTPELDRAGKPTDVWAAALQLPADKKEATVSAIATDGAGNPGGPRTGEALRIVIVDPPPPIPTGRIDGIVMFGELPQPGVEVRIVGGEGKIRKAVVTNASGKFCISGLVPGPYILVSGKTDVTTGVSGITEVTVEPGEKATPAAVVLKKNK